MSQKNIEKLREYNELQPQAAAKNDYHNFMFSDWAEIALAGHINQVKTAVIETITSDLKSVK